jgi:hypothetical protein
VLPRVVPRVPVPVLPRVLLREVQRVRALVLSQVLLREVRQARVVRRARVLPRVERPMPVEELPCWSHASWTAVRHPEHSSRRSSSR